jgi:hypothetical protein
MRLRGVKEIVVMVIALLALYGLFSSVDYGVLDKEKYLSKEALELSTPFDVTINLELISPAYDKQ